MQSIQTLLEEFAEGEYDAIIIAGQTASGKSALGIQLAKVVGGEIIGVDSRQIYKGMVIGTGSVTPSQQEGIPHHLVNVVGPEEVVTAASYQQKVYSCIEDILKRKKVPILVGGTGLYIDGIIFDYSFRGGPDIQKRALLEEIYVRDGIEGLRAYAAKEHPHVLMDDIVNPRHIMRVIETGEKSIVKEQDVTSLPKWKFFLILVEGDTLTLNKRIEARHAHMFDDSPSILDETKNLLAMGYTKDHEGMSSIGYRESCAVLEGNMSAQEAKEKTIRAAKQYAKRQRTWFRRLGKKITLRKWVMYP